MRKKKHIGRTVQIEIDFQFLDVISTYVYSDDFKLIHHQTVSEFLTIIHLIIHEITITFSDRAL